MVVLARTALVPGDGRTAAPEQLDFENAK